MVDPGLPDRPFFSVSDKAHGYEVISRASDFGVHRRILSSRCVRWGRCELRDPGGPDTGLPEIEVAGKFWEHRLLCVSSTLEQKSVTKRPCPITATGSRNVSESSVTPLHHRWAVAPLVHHHSVYRLH